MTGELRIKQRPRPAEDISADVDAAAGRTKSKAAPAVIKLGAKERLNSYVTPEQKKKLRLLAIEKGCSISEVVGVLIDETPKPEF